MIITSSIVFLCIAGGAMLGLYLRSVVPEHHLSAESREVVKLGMGLIGTMTALLLGMQIASAKDTYDAADGKIKEIAAKIGLMDRMMVSYGPQTQAARKTLRAILARGIDELWPKDGKARVLSPGEDGADNWYGQLQELHPENATQAALKTEIISLATEAGKIRWLMFAQSKGSGSPVFVSLVVVWLSVVFVSFGLLGPPNATVITTLLVCALSVSAAIGLIMELNRPFGGLIQISSEPLRQALQMMGS